MRLHQALFPRSTTTIAVSATLYAPARPRRSLAERCKTHMPQENLQFFNTACIHFGVPTSDLFDPDDFYDEVNISQVVVTLHSLSRVLAEAGFEYPTISDEYMDVRGCFTYSISPLSFSPVRISCLLRIFAGTPPRRLQPVSAREYSFFEFHIHTRTKTHTHSHMHARVHTIRVLQSVTGLGPERV